MAEHDWCLTVEVDGLITWHGDIEALPPRRREVAKWIIETVNDAGDKKHKRGKYAGMEQV